MPRQRTEAPVATVTRSLTLLALGVVAIPAFAEDDRKPLAPELVAAETIYVKQTLIDPRIVSRFRSEIAKWERFEVVAAAEDADIVAALSAQVEYTQTVADSGVARDDGMGDTPRGSETGLRPTGTVRTLQDVHLEISRRDGTELWTDVVPISGMSGSAAKRLVRRLRKRFEQEG